ncbi:MAG: hypothetical protein ACSLFN_04945 [Candidatus Limnocylindrales bacterium]
MKTASHSRNAIVIGASFAVIGIIFFVVPTVGGWHVDYAGVTLLLCLGIAMSIMAYVLTAGSSND